jgi:GT2 family glycosyltransferase
MGNLIGYHPQLSGNNMSKDYAILTVAYLTSKEHKNMAIKSYETMPDDIQRLAIVNNNDAKLALMDYNDGYIENDENCLAKAWNTGLELLFKTYDYVLVSNLDVMFTGNLDVKLREGFDQMARHEGEDVTGIIAATYTKDVMSMHTPLISTSYIPVKHGDGSFSCYMISKKMFEDVGYFDENFKPAYFEDDDYLERAKAQGYMPMRREDASFWHYGQGTVQNDKELSKEYATFMQKNLEYYKKKHKGVPDHLPTDIRFK